MRGEGSANGFRQQHFKKMGDLLNTFGVNFWAFFSQVIIILVVYLILKKFAFGPVLALLEERRKRIADGEANLDKIREQMEQALE